MQDANTCTTKERESPPSTACAAGSTVQHIHASPKPKFTSDQGSASLNPVPSNQEHAKQRALLPGPKARVKCEKRQMHMHEVQAVQQQDDAQAQHESTHCGTLGLLLSLCWARPHPTKRKRVRPQYQCRQSYHPAPSSGTAGRTP